MGPLHVHREAEEAFYILEGELTIFSEHRALAAPAGSFVLIPRGTVHSIANLGEGPCRWVTMISPAWVSAWIEEEHTNPEDRAAIYDRYGLEIVGPPPTPQ